MTNKGSMTTASLTTIITVALLATFTASQVWAKPVLHGSVGDEGTINQDQNKQSSTSLGRADVETTSALTKTDAKANVVESKEVELAWDAWHKQLAAAIYSRFDLLAYHKFQDSPPLGVKIRYLVTKDGRIVGLKVIQKSADMMFDALACQAIMWQGRKPELLKFPEGSNRQSVEKFATFTQNMGDEGFQATEGDKETVRVDN